MRAWASLMRMLLRRGLPAFAVYALVLQSFLAGAAPLAAFDASGAPLCAEMAHGGPGPAPHQGDGCLIRCGAITAPVLAGADAAPALASREITPLVRALPHDVAALPALVRLHPEARGPPRS
jgi:hypothetical protein